TRSLRSRHRPRRHGAQGTEILLGGPDRVPGANRFSTTRLQVGHSCSNLHTGCLAPLARGGRATPSYIRNSQEERNTALRSKLLARLTCAALFAGCVFGLSTAAASAATLNGAGSTLVAPIEAEWAAAWGQSTGNTVNYAGVGSGTGYTDIARGLVDFGASDAPLSVYSTPPCANCVQIPWALTATGVSYRVDGIRFVRGQHSLHLT